MAGKGPGGAPPGNINAVKHLYKVWWRRRAMPKRVQKRILPVLQRYEADLVSHLGGEGEITTVQEERIDRAKLVKGTIILIAEEAAKRGFFVESESDGTWDIQPALKELRKFIELEMKILDALGDERKARTVNGDLQGYLAQLAAPQNEDPNEGESLDCESSVPKKSV